MASGRHIHEDFALPVQRAGLEALGRQHHRLAAKQRRSNAARAARDSIAPVTARMTMSAGPRHRGGHDGRMQGLRAQIAAIGMAGIDLVDLVWIAHHQRNLAPSHGGRLKPAPCPRRPPPMTLTVSSGIGTTFMSPRSSDQRGRAVKSEPVRTPSVKRSAPAQATMAPLSVQSAMGGTTNCAPASVQIVRKAEPMAWFARHAAGNHQPHILARELARETLQRLAGAGRDNFGQPPPERLAAISATSPSLSGASASA